MCPRVAYVAGGGIASGEDANLAAADSVHAVGIDAIPLADVQVRSTPRVRAPHARVLSSAVVYVPADWCERPHARH